MSSKKFVTLPESDMYLSMVNSYVEKEPDIDYDQASEEAREAFRDMKFGVRIHWGLYTLLNLQGESWPFLKMPFEERHRYQQLYREFNPDGFDAREWMRLFKKAGMKCFAFTAKHHEGFSMFDTQTRVKRRVDWASAGGPQVEECNSSYSVMDSPFRRDIVRELCDAAREFGINIDLYFSNPDWYDADFRPYGYHPLTVPESNRLITEREISDIDRFFGGMKPVEVPCLTPEEKEEMVSRHRRQLTELLTNYGKIDMVCLDNWFGPDVWPELKETMKILRKIQPDCMFRARGIGNYGDYYTPEGFVPGSKENTDMPWMVIYPLANSFSYDPEESHYKGGAWIVRNLIDSVAKGGNFMVGIGPDASGRWHPEAVRDLEYAGRWLKVNGEAIYGTRPRPGSFYREGNDIYFTRTKDWKYTYAICTGWPGRTLSIQTMRPRKGTDVMMLGYGEKLPWNYKGDGFTLDLPECLQDESGRPCETAYSFRFEAVQDHWWHKGGIQDE